MSDKRKGDRDDFRRLAEAIDGDELPALLHDLLATDLSGFDHRNPPHTAGLNRQKLGGADSLTKYRYGCLLHGELIGTGESEWPGAMLSLKWAAETIRLAACPPRWGSGIANRCCQDPGSR